MSKPIISDIRTTRTTLILTENGQEKYYPLTLGMYMDIQSGNYASVREALATMTPYRITEARI